MFQPRLISVLAGTLFALVGCAADPTSTATAAPSPAPVASPSEAAEPGPPSGSGAVTWSPSYARGAITVTGRVVAGVEPGCRLLRSSRPDYLLVVEPPLTMPRLGARVRVTGVAQPDLMSTCMQGVPFVVSRIRPA